MCDCSVIKMNGSLQGYTAARGTLQFLLLLLLVFPHNKQALLLTFSGVRLAQEKIYLVCPLGLIMIQF